MKVPVSKRKNYVILNFFVQVQNNVLNKYGTYKH